MPVANNALPKWGQDEGTSAAAKWQLQFGAGHILLNFALNSTAQFQLQITAQQILALNPRTSAMQNVGRHLYEHYKNFTSNI